MKKKLIAIVASLAMVATMVPASAFGATEDLSVDNDITAKTKARLSIETGSKSASNTTATDEAVTSLTMTDYGTKSKVVGWLPYVKKHQSWNTAKGWSGHFATLNFDVTKEEAGADGWVLYMPIVEHDHTASGNAENGPFIDPYTVWGLSDMKTDVAKQTIRLEDYNGTYEVQVMNVKTGWDNTATGDTPLTAYHGTYTAFATSLPSGIDRVSKHLYTMNDLAKVIAKNEDPNGDNNKTDSKILSKATLSIDYSGVKLLSKEDTEDLGYFTTTAGAISGTIDRTYCKKVEAAEKAYNDLSATVKDAIAFSVDKFLKEDGTPKAGMAPDDAATAYAALETGLKNVESYNNLSDVASLIKAIPSWKAEYANDDTVVAQVEAAVKAESKLTSDVHAILVATSNGYLTQSDIDNYDAAQKGINNKTVANVIAKIDALQTIATDFNGQDSVEAIAGPWKEACEAYNDLTEAQKANVTNASKLTSYTKAYKTATEKYVNPIWEAVADIDLKNGLKAEDRAKVAELKNYIDKEYVNTKQMDVEIEIKDFDKRTYAKLVEALNGANENVYSLEKATVEAIADQTYTGKAIKPTVVVKDGEGNEIAAENYYVSYDNNLEVGEATVTIVAKSTSDYYGEASATFTITPAALTADMVKVANATYTGKAVRPAVSVASGVDYTVAYRNNTAVGKASAVVTGTGNYTGTITKNFIVKPAKESITSLKAGKKQITVAYKAQTGAKYRVICKASGLKAVGTNTTATKKTVKKLKSGKTYQVKVRAYKAVDGTTYYGAYSAVKKVKVK